MKLFTASLPVCCHSFLNWSPGYQFCLPQIPSAPSCHNALSQIQSTLVSHLEHDIWVPSPASPFVSFFRFGSHSANLSPEHTITFHTPVPLHRVLSAWVPPYHFMSVSHVLLHFIYHFLRETLPDHSTFLYTLRLGMCSPLYFYSAQSTALSLHNYVKMICWCIRLFPGDEKMLYLFTFMSPACSTVPNTQGYSVSVVWTLVNHSFKFLILNHDFQVFKVISKLKFCVLSY